MEERIGGTYRMEIPGSQFSLSTDSMVLADFAHARKGARICDLGCGCGALGILLLAKDPSLHITGIEIQPEAARFARENAAKNDLPQLEILQGDLRECRALLPANGFDAVVSNPPYYPAASGALAQSASLAAARSEVLCTLPDLCHAAAWCLRFGGSFFLVHKPERLTDLLVHLREHKLEPKRLQFVRHSVASQVCLVLIEARLGAKPGVSLQQDLILFDALGQPTGDYLRIYHQE